MSDARISRKALNTLIDDAVKGFANDERNMSELLPMRQVFHAVHSMLESIDPGPTRYRLVEAESKEHTIKVDSALVVEGPVEDVLVLSYPEERLQALMSLGCNRMEGFARVARKTVKDAGWEGEIIIVSDDMKFARFEPVEDDSE